MSLGKLTLLSADCDGSGAAVGSAAVAADSSGAAGGGCPVGVGTAAPGAADTEAGVAWPAALAGAGRWLACSAARSVTNAAPKNNTVLTKMSQIDRLFGITH